MSDLTATSVPNNGFTHGGVFHADDVFAAALLTMLNPSIEIQRGYKVPADFDGIVFDVGGGEFDHHGTEAKVRINGTPYASFGLIWRRYGTLLLCEEDARAFDEAFVQPIDDADCGGALCQISQLVSDFNPTPPVAPSKYDDAFHESAAWALGVLKRRLGHIREARDAKDYVLSLMGEGDGKVLVLDRLVQWKEPLVGSTYVYVIYPSIRGGFNVQAVPERLGDHSMVLPFPEAWRGASAEKLRELTDIDDFDFCHPTGFLCAVGSREGALAAARLSIEMGLGNR